MCHVHLVLACKEVSLQVMQITAFHFSSDIYAGVGDVVAGYAPFVCRATFRVLAHQNDFSSLQALLLLSCT